MLFEKIKRRIVSLYQISRLLGFWLGLIVFLKYFFVKNKLIEVHIYGIKFPIYLRTKTSDIFAFKEVFVNKCYEQQLGLEPKVIIDAGANIGMTSIFYAAQYPNAKIIALECESSNFAILKKNVALYQNIMPLKKALWNKNTYLNIFDPHTYGNVTFQTREIGSTESIVDTQVESITVNEIMRQHNLEYVDILKVDIEGAEMEVFSVANTWIGNIGVIVIELHDRFKPGCSEAFYNATKQFEFEVRKEQNVVFKIRTPYKASVL
ncbi:MAG: FkbM family methyltransferase [Pseudomonadota bacterium]